MLGQLSKLSFLTLWLIDHLFGPTDREFSFKARRKLCRRIASSKDKNEFSTVEEISKTFLTIQDLKTLPPDRPVLFRGLGRNTRAFKDWTIENLRQRYSGALQPLWGTRENYDKMAEILPFGDFLAQIQSGKADHAYYGGYYDILNSNQELIGELDMANFVDQSFLKNRKGKVHKIFISGKAHWTPTHSDIGGNLTFQIRGKKKWTIIRPEDSVLLMPEVSRTPYFQSGLFADGKLMAKSQCGLKGWQVTIEAGDILWMPSFFWHFIETLEDSISVSTKWFSIEMFLKRPFLSTLAVTSRNPNLVASYLNRSFTLRERHFPSKKTSPIKAGLSGGPWQNG